jgi:hypothetical protein
LSVDLLGVVVTILGIGCASMTGVLTIEYRFVEKVGTLKFGVARGGE